MHLSTYCLVEGRRHERLVMLPETPSEPSLGDWLASAAYLDAASASAYERLHRELATFEAPERLVHDCARAYRTELCHADDFARLARRYGARPSLPPKPVGLRLRAPVDMAIANAREGIVRTTYGAAAARFRAQRATAPDIREVMQTIADDECEHAELSLRLAVWLTGVLDPIEWAFVESAMKHEIVALAHDLDREPGEGLERAGVPDRRDALAIWCGLSHNVWRGLADRVWGVAPCAA
jgi:hypothetical protein